jgi:hypothetical protein
MKQYMLGIHQPDGDPPPPEVMEPIMRDLNVLNDEIKAAGAWVFAAGLYPPGTATVLRADPGADSGAGSRDVLMTDGPFAEGKEYLGGFTIIRAPDLDGALEWGRRLAQVLAPLAIEVRPLYGED